MHQARMEISARYAIRDITKKDPIREDDITMSMLVRINIFVWSIMFTAVGTEVILREIL